MYRLKIWTGPVAIEEIAEFYTKGGFAPAIIGTEHLYFDVEGATEFDAKYLLYNTLHLDKMCYKIGEIQCVTTRSRQ